MARDNILPQSNRDQREQKDQQKVQYFTVAGRFLIVCEGTQTEPNYFNWYKNELQRLKKSLGRHVKINGIEVEVAKIGDEIAVEGTGKNTKSVVKDAMLLVQDIINKSGKDKQVDYQVWCVFDRDSFPSKNFNDAIRLAKAKNINVAYSNESFELWYLLHYDYHESALSRVQYQKKLSARLGKPYQKNSQTMYEELRAFGGDQQRAIQNAERLLKTYGDRTDYANHNPSTTVHLLVNALNKFLEDFNRQTANFRDKKS